MNKEPHESGSTREELQEVDMQKDPMLACLLSLILVGTGHMYLGQVGKGVAILAIGIALAMFTHFILYVPFVIWAMYSAYSTASKLNQL